MDFSVSEEMQYLLTNIEGVMLREVYPLEKDFIANGFYAVEPRIKEARRKVKGLGLWAPQLPRELGGMGLMLLEHALVSQVLGKSPLGHYVFGCPAPDAGNIEILHKYGTEQQKRAYLEPLAAGEVRSCFSMTEPENPGSNPTRLSCRAESDGDDYVITGRKWFTSAADGAAFAIVMAVTNPEAPPHLRASQIIVPTDTPGFQRVRNISIMGRPGDGYASHAEIVYDGCRVPKSNRLGPEGQGFRIAQERLGPGRIHHCMRWLGIAERAFELMCQRAASRRIDDAETLAHKGIVQAWIAESRIVINAARLSVLEAAWKIDRLGFAEAKEEISLIKFYVAKVMLDVVDRAIQTHGALGITDDTVLAYFYAHERGARIYDGPDEVHKVAASRQILKRFAPRKEGEK
jgi:acyl-CoA dehydrogenase